MTFNPAHTMPFSKLMGVNATTVSAEAVEGEITVREDLCTTGGIMHGGAIMAFADALGALGAFASLPEGAKGTIWCSDGDGSAPLGPPVVRPAPMDLCRKTQRTGGRSAPRKVYSCSRNDYRRNHRARENRREPVRRQFR